MFDALMDTDPVLVFAAIIAIVSLLLAGIYYMFVEIENE